MDPNSKDGAANDDKEEEGAQAQAQARTLQRGWLRSHHPTLYWNLLWWCARLGLPLPLAMDTPENPTGPTGLEADPGQGRAQKCSKLMFF